ncbi:amino acid adenylation domain-containing protein [Calothrix sp. FACHB-1219]|uniref:non-ribosomal peptide synthetase n=1 Tax=unclassified Calothrix TaxID=2619626 RepID=UPI001682AF32|nr:MULTISPECIES: non-ribosomal peptide synthetase [unclassified Calothrix]MBD2201846.1 amino acid adenylation domain-containing protein [Calothrix sp. FACHB-168]MBD2217532.1 amino acid adenylation domain-containing protein [Calothrix sp. FACHB-1219]
MSDLNQRIAQLSPEKRELLLQRLNQKQAIVAPSQIPRQSRDSNHFPLSFAQQRLWFLSQLEPNNPFYNQPTALRLTGQLNIAILKQSLKEIMRRHETLRTTFTIVNDKPVQVINSAVDLTLPLVDLQNLTPNLQEQEVQKLAAQEAQQPFNLEQGPLLRVTILKLNAIEHVVLFTTHHIVSDGWSVGILVEEVAKIYTALANNQPAPLPELPIQYADFAVWQRQYLTAEVIKSQISYWRNHLGTTPPLLDLPHDYPRPAILSYQGNTKFFLLSESLTKALKALSQQEGVTLFMTLLTAFKILLHRYSQQDDIVVGTAIANRHRAEIEPLIGFFVNTLVLRTNLAGNPSFRQLLKQVREVTLGAYAHQDLPFEQLVEELQPERHLNRNPLFDVMFDFHNEPVQELKLPELTFSLLSEQRQTAIFDLALTMAETEQGLAGTIEYSTDLFNASTIERMLGHFQVLLAAIVAEPEQRLADLPLLTAFEQHQLLREWNQTAVDYPTDKCIQELFQQQVECTPEAVAVVYKNQQLTYRELNTKANQLAHYLHSLGVHQNVLVGICIERSIEMIVALLGVLKAGGAYVPLDPAYPQERLSFMLHDSQVTVLLTQQKLLSSLPIKNCSLVCLDTDWQIISQQSQVNLVTHSTPDDLAYVIYTSGSTGKSKGVAIAHHSLVNKFYAWAKAYQLDCLTSHLQMASFAFDVFSGDLIRALCSGAKLVLCPREWLLEAEKLYQLMLAEKVDSAEFVPVVLKNLVQYLERTEQNLHFMRLLVVGSDTLYVKEYQEFQHICGEETRLINSYGVTEATIDSTYFESTEIKLSDNKLVPIGRPLANTEIYILDSHLQLVPIGIPGEIYIGGEGLAQGYLHRPDLTTEKFILWNGEKRLYKTGDKAKYLADGNIEFLGRLDYQIKLRGFRIELREIEAVINQHPGILASVVVLREAEAGNKTLVAYITIDAPNQLSSSELRRFLESKLPNYMLPNAFVILEALPLTPNGKLDRQALPLPDATHLIQQSNFVPASTPVQQMLVEIWKQVLGIEKLGIHDHFFELGGHSLLATQLISRIRQILHLELPLRCLFEAPTIAKLAAIIQTMVMQGQNWQNYPILPCSRQVKLPLSFAQNRLWFIDQLQPGNSAYNIFNGFRLQGSLNITALEQSINEIIRRHEILRTQFITVDGQPVQAIIPELQLTLPVIDLQTLSTAAQAAAVQQLITQAAQQPFDLTQAPLLRLSLVKLNPTEHIVLFAMHHIISDAWSMGILIRELTVIYQAYLNGEASPLAELSIQYADFAVWQREWLQGEMLKTQLSYWKQQLAGSLPVLNLPYSQTKANTNRSGIHTFKLSPELSIALEKLSREADVTLFMTMVAGLQTMLYRYTGQDDIVIGTDVANRNRAETEGIIGFFVNLLVLRTNLGGYPSFRELLQRVREVTLGAYNHQDLPFEKLVEELQPERSLSHTPLFQVLLVMDNVPIGNLELPGLTLLPLETNNQKAKFDLALFVSEIEQEIEASWCYNADLFDTQTIVRMAEHFQELLHNIATNPDARINTLDMLTKAEKQQKNMGEINQEASKFKKFMGIKPKSIKLPAGELIKIDYLQAEQTIPLVIKPNINEFDIIDWAKNNREFLSSKLQHHGAILFRDCQIDSVARFEQLAQAICPELFGEYGDLPREEIGSKVYGSTPYPADQAILFHNESSHMHCWPLKIWFFCLQPAQQGGETPIVDCRQLYQLLDSQIRETLEKKQLMYVRNYIEGLDVSWQDFFHTNDTTVVENYCHQAGIEFEWLANNNLRTRQIRPAIVHHPHTKEKVFFNQIQLHHISCLEPTVRESLLSMFGEENLPRNVYYGDGSAIEAEVMTEINQVYQQATISFPWQQGDVLMLDNMLTAHGRFPYVGPRKIVVAMGEMMKNSVFGHGA